MSLPSPAQDDYSPSPSPRALSQFTSSPLPHSPIALDPCESGAEDQFSGDPSHTNKQANNQENSVLEPLPMLDTSHSDSTSLDKPRSSDSHGVTHGSKTPKKIPSPSSNNKLAKQGNKSTALGDQSSLDAQKRRSQKSPLKQSKWLFSVMALVAVASGGLGASLALMMNSKPFQKPLTTQEAAVFNQEGSMTAGGAGLPSLSRPVNILVMGTIMLTSDLPGATGPSKERYLEELDNNLNGMSDAMLLIRFDPESRKVSVLSIPRDTRVPIQGVGVTKINFANYSGGASLAAQTVSRTLGDITIDRYVRLNVSGFGKLIDALGGVDVYVPKLMKYQDDSQHLYISLKAGQQKLNGSRAIQYMRYRHDDLGDIGRVQRQQAFFRALIEQKMKPATILKTPEIMNVLKENIDTNLSVEEILALGYFITQVQRQDVKMLMLPGRFANPGEFDTLSYWIFDQRLTRKLLDKHFGVPLPTRKDDNTAEIAPPVMRIAVQDSYAQPEGVKRATVRLSKAGYEQVFPAPEQPWHRPIPKTQIIAQGGDREAAEKVREALGLGEVLVESTGILESEVTVRIGQDWLKANNLPTKPPAPNANTTTNRNKSNIPRL
ncbi:MAG: LCP family protein [Pseudanabaena sp. ELA607]|jgi:LCP family protein required for cell wall assembly